MSLTKLGFDVNIDKKQKEQAKTWTTPAVAAGLTAASFKAHSDVTKARNMLDTWDESLKSYREIAKNRTLTIEESEKAIDTYVAGGRKLSRARVLGVPVGKGIITGGRVITEGTPLVVQDIMHVAKPDKVPAANYSQLKSTIDHYKMYGDKNISNESFRTHHIVKGLEQEYSTELKDKKIFTDEINKILHSPTPNTRQKITDIAKINPAAGKIVNKAVTGSGGGLGEAKRITGDAKGIVSTPEIYRSQVHLPVNVLKGALTAAKVVGVPVTLGLAYRKIKDSFKKEAAKKDVIENDTNAAGAIGTTVVGGGMAGLGAHAIKNAPKGIAVTYGTMTDPKNPARSVGSGHKMPATAIVEAIESDPRFKGQKVDVLNRDDYGIFRGTNKKYNTVIDTGLGAHLPSEDNKFFNPTRFTHGHDMPKNFKTQSHVRYLTDMVDEKGHNFGATWNWGGKNKGTVMSYGPNTKHMQDQGAKLLHVGDSLGPALHASKMEVASRVPRHQDVVLNDLADIVVKSAPKKAIETKGFRDELAQQAKGLRGLRGKEIISISGAGRGDYVTGRAHELQGELRKNKMDKTHGVLAIPSGAATESGTNLIKSDKAIGRMPKVMGDLYNEAQSISKVNWAATGTSGLSESLVQRNVQAIPSHWGYRNVKNKTTGEMEEIITPNSIAGKQDELMKKHDLVGHNANVDIWNEGNMQFAHKQPGVIKANNSQDIIDILKNKPELEKKTQESIGRSTKLKGDYYAARTKMLDVIHETVQGNIKKTRLKGAAGLAVGAGIAYLGAEKVKETIHK